MKFASATIIGIGLMLAGCSPESPKKTDAPVFSAPATPEPEPEPQTVLLPLYEAVINCLLQCESKWYQRPSGNSLPAPIFEPKLPGEFADLVSMPEEYAKFVAMIDQLPPHLQSVGKLELDDEDEFVGTEFDGRKQKKPILNGDLRNVIFDKQRAIYIYSNVYYMHHQDNRPGSLHVAIDPATKEYAGVLRGGDNLDQYYIAGSESLRSTLLAYTVADDLETANMLTHYTRKIAGAYEVNPIVLPLNKSLDEALERVKLLNDRLGNRNEAQGIPAPSYLQKAEAERAALAWYGVSQDRDECIESPMSPADQIDLIKSSGITLYIRETNSDGKLIAVEISADDGRSETDWRFFKSKADCEKSMAVAPTPEKYR